VPHDEALKPTVLIVDPDDQALRSLADLLRSRFTVTTATRATEADRALQQTPPAVIVCSHDLPDETGLDVLARVHEHCPETQGILVASALQPDLMSRAINEARLFRYFEKPVPSATICEAVEFAAIEFDILRTMDVVTRENKRLEQELERWPTRANRFARSVSQVLAQAMRLAFILMGLFAATVLVATVVSLIGLGVVYAAKTFLGIDLLRDAHLDDIIYRLLPER